MNKLLPLISIGFLLGFLDSYAQVSYTSLNNNQGSWDSPATWQHTPAASPLNVPGNPTNSSATAINIYGYVRKESGGLTVNNANPVLTIYDTLYVVGNVILGSGASMNIPGNGILIITGNLTLQGNFNLSNTGNVVVLGNVNITNGSISTNNNFYAFGSTTASGGGTVNGCNPYYGCSPASQIHDENDLANDNPSLFTFATNGGQLPIELLFFTANAKGQQSWLRWATAMETNFDRFEIERAGADLNFKTIGSIRGRGESRSVAQYTFTDPQPLEGVNFYRLKSIDFDDSYSYSSVQRSIKALVGQIKVYPNPAHAAQALFIEHDCPDQTSAELFSINGQRLAVTNFSNHQAQIKLPENIQRGIYFLKVNGHTAQRIIIED